MRGWRRWNRMDKKGCNFNSLKMEKVKGDRVGKQ
jgi:hypothetical protein